MFGIHYLLKVLVAATVMVGLGTSHDLGHEVDHGPGGTAPVRPFRLDQVRLGSGLLAEKRDRMISFLRDYDERRFLVLFNKLTGRENPNGVEPPGGWEDGGLLSGHWTGHFLTAISQAYAEKGDAEFKKKLDWMVDELATVQQAFLDTNTTHDGYLGALPEDTVLRLGPPRFALYGGNLSNNTWAPWYTQHKIMRGLLDAYYNANNTKALDVVVKMADWAHLALTIGDKNHPDYKGNLTRDDLNYMWDTYIAGEFGGANEVFPEIYALTGDKKHLETAKTFDNRESLFGAAVEDRDILVVRPEEVPGRRRAERLHANTHIPQFLGYMRIYEHSNSSEYFDAAKNFYGWVVPHREFASGGTGGIYPGPNDTNPELFQNRDNIANAMSGEGAETCTTYNTLKLARNLFLHEHDAAYMDHYERGLFNMITGSRADADDNTEPQVTYFQPLKPGSHREYGNTGTCCGGTGMESHTKYQETVYLRSADGSALWINLYVPSTLTWAEKSFSIQQETAFPRGDTANFTISTSGYGAEPVDLEIKLRVPGWIRKRNGFQVKINNEPQSLEIKPSSYLSLKRTWFDGDTIQLHMPFSIRTERARDRPEIQALMWGPILLQTIGTPPPNNSSSNSSATSLAYHKLSLYKHLKLDGDYAQSAIVQKETTPSGDLLFTARESDLEVRPYYISPLESDPVSSYFQRVEPTIVFGNLDTGVPNRVRNDGLPNYDVPVKNVVSPGTDGPSFLDLVWDRAPFQSFEDFSETVKEVADEFVGLNVLNEEEREIVLKGAEEAREQLGG